MAPQQFSVRKTHMRPGSCQAVEKDGPAIGLPEWLPECATFCYWRGRFSCVSLFACTNGVFLASVYIYMYTYVRIYEHPLYIQRIDFYICVYIHILLTSSIPTNTQSLIIGCGGAWSHFLLCFACLAALLRVQCFLFCAS